MASYSYRPQRPDRPHRVSYRDPHGRQCTRSFTSEKTALRFMTKIEGALERGEYVDTKAGRGLLSDLADEYVQGAIGLADWTERTNASLLRSRILPTFGDEPLSRITAGDIKRWVHSMEKEELSASRIKKALGLLRQILQTAVDDNPRRLASNPAASVKAPAVIPPDHLYLNEEQLAALEIALDARVPGMGLVAVLGGYEGLRWGEMRSCARSWVDLQRRKLSIRESNFVRGAKNRRTGRIDTVSLAPHAFERLTFRLAEMPSESKALVLTDGDGQALDYHRFRKTVWNPVIREHGFQENLTPHALRHTCASILIDYRWNPKKIQAHMRHSSIRITMDLYGHLLPEDEEQAWADVEAGRQQAHERALKHTGPIDLNDRRGRE